MNENDVILLRDSASKMVGLLTFWKARAKAYEFVLSDIGKCVDAHAIQTKLAQVPQRLEDADKVSLMKEDSLVETVMAHLNDDLFVQNLQNYANVQEQEKNQVVTRRPRL